MTTKVERPGRYGRADAFERKIRSSGQITTMANDGLRPPAAGRCH